jgi:drug/metabolite transporter (DMT)-like permease
MIQQGSAAEKIWPAVLDSLEQTIRTGSPVVSSAVQRELHPDDTGPLILAYGGVACCVLIVLVAARVARPPRSKAAESPKAGTPHLERFAKLTRTEAFAWTCAITAIGFGSMGFFLSMVMFRSSTSFSSIAFTFLAGLAGALVFGFLGRRVMKYSIPIALIVMGGLLILTPIAARSYENTQTRQLLAKSGQSPSLNSPGFQFEPLDFLSFVTGCFMVAGGAVWPALANLLGRLFGPRPRDAAKTGEAIDPALNSNR